MLWCRRQRLGDLFAKELRDYAASKRRADADTGNSSEAAATRAALLPISATVMGEMMAYYKVYNRKFANPMKITRICRSFQAKARVGATAADHAATEGCAGGSANDSQASESNDHEGWVDAMYAALAEKNGGVGPREIPHSRGSSTASCGYVPVETTAAAASKPADRVSNPLGSVPLQEVNAH